MFDDNTNTVSAIDRIYEEDPDSWEEDLLLASGEFNHPEPI